MLATSPQRGTPRNSVDLPITRSLMNNTDAHPRAKRDEIDEDDENEEYQRQRADSFRRSSTNSSYPGDSALIASIAQELDRNPQAIVSVEDQTNRDRQLAMRLQERYALIRPPRERLGSSERRNAPAWQSGEPQVGVVEVDPTPENSENEETQSSGVSYNNVEKGSQNRGRRSSRAVMKVKHWGKTLINGMDSRPAQSKSKENKKMADRRDGGPGPPTGYGSAKSVVRNQDTCVVN